MPGDIVAELDAELALIEQLPYRVPIHALARRARDEILALRKERERAWRDIEPIPSRSDASYTPPGDPPG